MNRAVDTTTTEQRAIGGIHNGIDVERRNIRNDNLELGVADSGGEQGHKKL